MAQLSEEELQEERPSEEEVLYRALAALETIANEVSKISDILTKMHSYKIRAGR